MVLYRKLKGLIAENDYNQVRLAKQIGRSPSYIGERFRDEKPWSMEDVYTICDLLGIDYCQIPEYFPRNGGRRKPA